MTGWVDAGRAVNAHRTRKAAEATRRATEQQARLARDQAAAQAQQQAAAAHTAQWSAWQRELMPHFLRERPDLAGAPHAAVWPAYLDWCRARHQYAALSERDFAQERQLYQ